MNEVHKAADFSCDVCPSFTVCQYKAGMLRLQWDECLPPVRIHTNKKRDTQQWHSFEFKHYTLLKYWTQRPMLDVNTKWSPTTCFTLSRKPKHKPSSNYTATVNAFLFCLTPLQRILGKIRVEDKIYDRMEEGFWVLQFISHGECRAAMAFAYWYFDSVMVLQNTKQALYCCGAIIILVVNWVGESWGFPQKRACTEGVSHILGSVVSHVGGWYTPAVNDMTFCHPNDSCYIWCWMKSEVYSINGDGNM